MYFALQSVNSPNRSWARKVPKYMSDHFNDAFSSSDYVDRDYLDEDLINIYFIPKDYKSISKKYIPILREVSKSLEVVLIWDDIIPPGFIDPITTFSITGYWEDVGAAHRILNYIINGFNALEIILRTEYRTTKINRRRRTQARGEKTIKYKHAKSKVADMIRLYLITTHKAISEVEKTYSVLHERKLESINNHILKTKKLNFKKYNYNGQPEIHNAVCKSNTIILKRIIA